MAECFRRMICHEHCKSRTLSHGFAVFPRIAIIIHNQKRYFLRHDATPQCLFCTSHKHPLSAPDATNFPGLCNALPLGAFLKAKVKANVRPLNGVISFAQVSLLCEVFWLGAAQSWPGESNLCRKTRSFTQKLAARDFLVLHPYG